VSRTGTAPVLWRAAAPQGHRTLTVYRRTIPASLCPQHFCQTQPTLLSDAPPPFCRSAGAMAQLGRPQAELHRGSATQVGACRQGLLVHPGGILPSPSSELRNPSSGPVTRQSHFTSQSHVTSQSLVTSQSYVTSQSPVTSQESILVYDFCSPDRDTSLSSDATTAMPRSISDNGVARPGPEEEHALRGVGEGAVVLVEGALSGGGKGCLDDGMEELEAKLTLISLQRQPERHPLRALPADARERPGRAPAPQANARATEQVYARRAVLPASHSGREPLPQARTVSAHWGRVGDTQPSFPPHIERRAFPQSKSVSGYGGEGGTVGLSTRAERSARKASFSGEGAASLPPLKALSQNDRSYR